MHSEEKNGALIYWIVLDEAKGKNVAYFANGLRKQSIITHPFFLEMHKYPVFHDMECHKGRHYPETERLTKQGLYLPSGLTLTGEQMNNRFIFK